MTNTALTSRDRLGLLSFVIGAVLLVGGAVAFEVTETLVIMAIGVVLLLAPCVLGLLALGRARAAVGRVDRSLALLRDEVRGARDGGLQRLTEGLDGLELSITRGIGRVDTGSSELRQMLGELREAIEAHEDRARRIASRAEAGRVQAAAVAARDEAALKEIESRVKRLHVASNKLMTALTSDVTSVERRVQHVGRDVAALRDAVADSAEPLTSSDQLIAISLAQRLIRHGIDVLTDDDVVVALELDRVLRQIGTTASVELDAPLREWDALLPSPSGSEGRSATFWIGLHGSSDRPDGERVLSDEWGGRLQVIRTGPRQ